MSWIIKQLSGSLGSYIMIAMVVIIAGLGLSTKVLWSHNAKLQHDLLVSNAHIDALTNANVSNKKSITTLVSANRSWVDFYDRQKIKDEQAAASQLEFRNRVEAAANAMVDSIRKERQEPDCAAIMQIDIQRVCPVAAKRMRVDAAAGTN